MPAQERADGPSISVVIVNWNAAEDLHACLDSLAAQTDRDFQTLVVDNASADASLAVLARYDWVEVIETGANLGFAEGCNQGLARATGEWIATLNNDTVADRGWIAALKVAARAATPDIGMLQSRMVFRDDHSRINSTGLQLYTDGTAADRDFDRPVSEDPLGDAEVFCPTAGAALYRRSMLEATRLPTGWFDREFFMYCEDVDLGWRCQLAGWKAVYVREAVVAHAFQGTSKKRERHFIGLHLKRNRLRTLLKNASPGFLVRTLPRTLLDLGRAFTAAGPFVLPSFAIAVRDGLAQRRAVQALARVPRHSVEDRWVERRPR